jgi:hypothetical protein
LGKLIDGERTDARGAVEKERGWSAALYLVGGWLAEVKTEGGGHPKGVAGPAVVGLRLVGGGTLLHKPTIPED